MRIAQLLAVSIGLTLAMAGCGGSGSTPAPPGEVRPLAFVSNRDGDDEIYVMRADGTGLVNVTDDPTADDTGPAWSPDRTRIAYVSDKDGNTEIYVVNAATGAVTQLTNTSSDWDHYQPCWSPDGTKIAYVLLGQTTGSTIHVMNANGSGTPMPLATGISPAWSPDGTKIAYTFLSPPWPQSPTDAEIYVINASGGGHTSLTDSAGASLGPAWSPNGTEIAFFSQSPGGSQAILKMTSAGGSIQWLADIVSGIVFLEHPCWSADGSKIVFMSAVGGDDQIHIMNADGTGLQVLLAVGLRGRSGASGGT